LRLFYSRPSRQCLGRTIGKKRVTSEILDRLDNLALAVWFMDDATCEKHKRARSALVLYVGAMTDGEYSMIHQWFISKGYPCVLSEKKQGNCRRIRFSADASYRLAARLRPHFHESMLYKLEGIGHVSAQEKASWRTRLTRWRREHPDANRGDNNGTRRHPERVPRGEKNGNAKLRLRDVNRIRRMLSAGKTTQAVLAAEYKVSKQLISSIANYQCWTR
jgi:hypothetical protein